MVRLTPAPFLASILLVTAPFGLYAQDSREAVEELLHRLEVEGGDAGDQAAFELFSTWKEDERLGWVLSERKSGSKKEARLCVLRALKYCGRQRPVDACRLVQHALDDSIAEVVQYAIATFATIEDGETYTYIQQSLGRLSQASTETSSGRQARALVQVLERLRNSQRATGVLVEVLFRHRLDQGLEQAIREALERMTAQRFVSPYQWRGWWESVKGLSLGEWRREVSTRRTEVIRRIEGTAEELFARLLAALQNDPTRLLEELEKGLTDETIPSVCKRAVNELGRIGRSGPDSKPERDRAVALLKARLQKGASTDYDEIQGMVLVALGRTGDVALLKDILEFLEHESPRMRSAAARSLGALGAPQAIAPLLKHLDEEDAELVENVIVALGEIQRNPTLEGETRVSDVLIRYCRRLLEPTNGHGPAPQAESHLARAAEALGKLPYTSPQDPAIASSVALLTDLSAYAKDTNVRFYAIAALGPLQHPGSFVVLQSRLGKETVIRVKKAILDGIGLQAINAATPDLAPQAIDLLVPYLFATGEEEALSRKSRQRLTDIARGQDLAGLEYLVGSLKKGREEKAALLAALPFLRHLPAPEVLPESTQPQLDRYYRLLVVRAEAFLASNDAKAAKADFDAVLKARAPQAPQAMTPALLPIYLGRGRVLLRVSPPDPEGAFEHAWSCLTLMAQPEADRAKADEAWGVALDALEQVKALEPKRVKAMLDRLQALAESAPEDVKKKLGNLKRGGS